MATRIAHEDFRGYQVESIERMLAEPTHGILLASPQDSGKTLMAAEFLIRSGVQRVLIVGVRDTYLQWKGRIEAQSYGAQTVLRLTDTAEGKRNLEAFEWGAAGIYFISHALLTRRDHEVLTDTAGTKVHIHKEYWASLPALDAVVVDEVHMMSRSKAKGQVTLHSLPIAQDGWRLALSGTFNGNKFENAWSPAYFCWPDVIPASFWFWKGQWCREVTVKTAWGTDVVHNGRIAKKIVGEKVPGAFVNSLPCYIRVGDSEGVPDPKVIYAPLSDTQHEVYAQLEAQSLAWLEGKPWVLELPISQRTALKTALLAEPYLVETGDPERPYEADFRADAPSSKIDMLFAELALYPQERVVIATDRKKFAKVVAARMRAAGMLVAEWTGDTSERDRELIKENWLSSHPNRPQYIVGVMKSMSTGLDWMQHDTWRIGVLSSPEGDPTTKGQFLKRVYRTGPHKEKFEWFEIVAEGTIDEGIFQNVELQALALDRSRMVSSS